MYEELMVKPIILFTNLREKKPKKMTAKNKNIMSYT